MGTRRGDYDVGQADDDALGHVHVCAHGPERPSRRSFLGAAALTAGTFAAMPAQQAAALGEHALAMGRAGRSRQASNPRTGTRLVLLGTAGGPRPTAGRAGIATALVVGDGIYLIDAGRSAVTQFVNAGLDITKVKGVFVTHLHLDHVVDLFNLFAMGLFTLPSAGSPGIGEHIPVYGPGRANADVFPRPVADPIGGDNPAPGTADLIDFSTKALAYQLNQARFIGRPDVRDVIDVHEIPLPPGVVPSTGPPPPMDPVTIFENDDVRVSTTMVTHVFSSFAYRFDTDEGSFALSGDTARSPNVVTLASGADVLVHEAADVDAAVADGLPPELRGLYLEGHTDVHEVGAIAQDAGVGALVINHFLPARPDLATRGTWQRNAQRGFDGRVLVGGDLMEVDATGTPR